jgi:hypothetical protein
MNAIEPCSGAPRTPGGCPGVPFAQVVDPEAMVAVGITLPVNHEMGRALREQRPEGWR